MLIYSDAITGLKAIKKVDCIFMDPPDNIGLKYDNYVDQIERYNEWIELILRMSMDKANIIWLSMNSIHWAMVGEIVSRLTRTAYWMNRLFLWRYTFGQWNSQDCGYGFRLLVMIKKITKELEPKATYVASQRQILGDKRAKGPRIDDDVWDFQRITTQFERRSWHPTQHPEALIERILKYSKAESVFDPFLGSGTTAIVAERLKIPWSGAEISPKYRSLIETELRGPKNPSR